MFNIIWKPQIALIKCELIKIGRRGSSDTEKCYWHAQKVYTEINFIVICLEIEPACVCLTKCELSADNGEHARERQRENDERYKTVCQQLTKKSQKNSST